SAGLLARAARACAIELFSGPWLRIACASPWLIRQSAARTAKQNPVIFVQVKIEELLWPELPASRGVGMSQPILNQFQDSIFADPDQFASFFRGRFADMTGVAWPVAGSRLLQKIRRSIGHFRRRGKIPGFIKRYKIAAKSCHG